MAALTKDRNTPERDGRALHHPVKGGVQIFAGALVALDATGLAIPAAPGEDVKVVGVATAHTDNRLGADGDERLVVRRGVFAFANDAGAREITRADVGMPAAVLDDQTVQRSEGHGTPAGIIVGLDDDGVWVDVQGTDLLLDMLAGMLGALEERVDALENA